MKDTPETDLLFELPPSIDQLHGNQGSISDRSFAIVVSKYHLNITGKLLEAAVQTLAAHDVASANIKVLWVPGAWELTSATQMALEQKKYDTVMAFGCVIRGETTHDQHINTTVSNTLGQLSIDYSTPIAFGLLTCNSMEQAQDRAGGRVGNKGEEVAQAAIHMLRLRKEMAE